MKIEKCKLMKRSQLMRDGRLVLSDERWSPGDQETRLVMHLAR